ncbi:Undecaprenyl phosphate-alpha-4-amino-4-deoxy-L-arabinose arabinosyl transferase [Pseudovibrio axinellae]|uniref:Undecaprenyl phosphate-alpha-4-amino-4-deoxy-L-arabinose arabinosyl transferase n=2 Tax=Pseudovibrio axinellae TaxID=989403 RepID=A0A161XIG4_9HYPH|nr:Undecaprenyl phosphate-alpha-4-amino-4-deoxy-L-arabinose arabinosyl transferase [Pseudovibrio axinellae]SEQ78489.1 4-amino-4-deoxy-L-arabinose transferase [Pseudovibrio axinellae]
MGSCLLFRGNNWLSALGSLRSMEGIGAVMSEQMNTAMSLRGEEGEPQEAPALWLRVAGHDWLAPFVLLLVCLCLYLPGLTSVPPLDRDEPRFAQASKQMMETDNYVSIHFQDLARNKKPIGIYWLQVGAAKLLGYDGAAPIWVYRLPSVIGAIVAVLLTYWTARAFLREQASFLAALLVAFALILNAEAHLAKTDAVLLACVMLAQGGLARVWLAQQRSALWAPALIFWVGLALGVLIKGPIILLVCGLTVLSLSLWEKRFVWLGGLAPVTGLVLFLAIVSPWLVAIYIETDGTFFKDALGGDLWAKVGSGQESHGAPPLTHLLVSLVIFWPIPSFFLLGFKEIWRAVNSTYSRFLLCWLIPSWLVFELVSTKLPHYTLPMMPVLALLTAGVMVKPLDARAGVYLRYFSAFLLWLVPLGIFFAVLAAPLWLELWPSPPAAVLCGLSVIVAVSAGRKLVAGEFVSVVPAAGLSALLMFVGFWVFAAPAKSPIWVSSRLVEAVDGVPGCESKEVAAAGFHEPSLVFLQGTQLKLLGAEEAARFLAADQQQATAATGACKVALVEGRQLPRFDAEAHRLGLEPAVHPRVSGLNINGGKKLQVHVFSTGGAAQ